MNCDGTEEIGKGWGFIYKGLFREQRELKVSLSREAYYEEPDFSKISTKLVLSSIFKNDAKETLGCHTGNTQLCGQGRVK